MPTKTQLVNFNAHGKRVSFRARGTKRRKPIPPHLKKYALSTKAVAAHIRSHEGRSMEIRNFKNPNSSESRLRRTALAAYERGKRTVRGLMGAMNRGG